MGPWSAGSVITGFSCLQREPTVSLRRTFLCLLNCCRADLLAKSLTFSGHLASPLSGRVCSRKAFEVVQIGFMSSLYMCDCGQLVQPPRALVSPPKWWWVTPTPGTVIQTDEDCPDDTKSLIGAECEIKVLFPPLPCTLLCATWFPLV